MTINWSHSKIVIIGAARQGTALARYLATRGAHVVLNDRRPASELLDAQAALADLSSASFSIEWVCGDHPLSLLDGADLVCISGGVPVELPLVVEARRRGIPLSNDSQIFMEAAPCKVIGITGSAGKTTTTTLVGRMAQAATQLPHSLYAGRRAWVGGNIGSPLIAVLDQMQPADLAVMELSSFQLELMERSPQVASLLNITPNHLDRHGKMEAYSAAKARILDYQSAIDTAVLGRDDPGAWALAAGAKGQVLSFGLSALQPGQAGAFLQDGAIYLRPAGAQALRPELQERRLVEKQDIRLRGEHNLLNVMAACTIAAAAGLPVEAMQAGVSGFMGAPHRLEFVRSWGGADWYNDSIATAPERSMADIHSFDEPLVLLVGGRDKNLSWEAFADLAQRRARHVIVFGEASGKIIDALQVAQKMGSPGAALIHCSGLRQAVQAAAEVVQPGDVVLLSPGGTSFDEFKDFEERGACFVQWVNELP